MMRTLPQLLLLCAVLASASAAAEDKTPSAEDAAAAKQLFDDARELMGAEKPSQACPKFAESMRLDPHLGVQMNLALCYEKIGWTASAWVNFRDAETSARRAGDARADTAREHAEALEQKLMRLTIAVPSGRAPVAGLWVTRDGKEVPAAQWGSAVPVDPGAHVISASAPGKRRWQKRVEVAEEGANYRVTVPELADAPMLPAAPPAPNKRAQRIAGFAAGGLGIGGLVAGAALGIAAIEKDRGSKSSCLPDDPNQCTAGGAADRDAAIALGNGSTGALVAGGALVALGIALVLTAPPAAEPPKTGWTLWLGPGAGRASFAW